VASRATSVVTPVGMLDALFGSEPTRIPAIAISIIVGIGLERVTAVSCALTYVPEPVSTRRRVIAVGVGFGRSVAPRAFQLRPVVHTVPVRVRDIGVVCSGIPRDGEPVVVLIFRGVVGSLRSGRCTGFIPVRHAIVSESTSMKVCARPGIGLDFRRCHHDVENADLPMVMFPWPPC